MKNIFFKYFDNIRLLVQLLLICKKAGKYYNNSLIDRIKRGYILISVHKYELEEALNYGLLDPAVKESYLVNYRSKKILTKILRHYNPDNWLTVSAGKDIFYRYCMIMGLPIPQLYAICYSKSTGWTSINKYIYRKDVWAEYIDNYLPDEFVIKPAYGSHGKGVYVYRRSGDIYIDNNSTELKSIDIMDRLFNDPRYDAFIIQALIKEHPDIKALSNSDYLQTLRVITHFDKSGNFLILFSILKLIVGGNVTDNYDMGHSGNIVGNINISNGIIDSVIAPSRDKPGVIDIEFHPDTGKRLIGFQVPMWEQLVECLKYASTKFLPIRTIGWDVAISESGPLIIESNVNWDPVFLNLTKKMGHVITDMKN